MTDRATIIVIAGVALGLLGQCSLPDFSLNVLTLCMIYTVLAGSWDFLVGYAGQLSFGQAAFFALGGYGAALLSGKLGVDPWVSIPLGGLCAAVVGVVFSVPAMRLRGPYLALSTLALAETVRVILLGWTDVTRGDLGYSDFPGFPGIAFSWTTYYYITLAFAVGWLLVLYWVAEHTRFGLACQALRDDELRAKTLGMNVVLYKVAAFAVSAFVAGTAGGMYAHVVNTVHPNISSLQLSATTVVMAVLGGRGTIIGSLVGALVVVNVSQYLRFVGVVFNDIATGLALIAILWLAPDGIVGLVRRSWERIPFRRSPPPSAETVRSSVSVGQVWKRGRRR
jgi:branched-chain amino acid transport system permease protein